MSLCPGRCHPQCIISIPRFYFYKSSQRYIHVHALPLSSQYRGYAHPDRRRIPSITVPRLHSVLPIITVKTRTLLPITTPVHAHHYTQAKPNPIHRFSQTRPPSMISAPNPKHAYIYTTSFLSVLVPTRRPITPSTALWPRPILPSLSQATPISSHTTPKPRPFPATAASKPHPFSAITTHRRCRCLQAKFFEPVVCMLCIV